MTIPTAPRLIVYYDGGCAVCSREIGFYQRLRGADQLDWVDAARCEPGALSVDLPRAAALARLHVRIPNGQLLSGARAFAALWSTLPATRLLGRIAGQPGVVQVLEWGYRGFLVVRRRWRGPPSCRLPG